MSFDTFGLHARVMAGVTAAGYTSPTPIQKQAIPAALEGRDILGLAQTGTGKTAAFVLPLLHRLIDGPRGQIRALIVAPTRELAEQIHTEISVLGQATNLRSATVYGGVGMNPQVKALRGKAEIIVACPGRLLDHMQGGNANLSHLEILVLDEADHMFDMGFLPAIRSIMKRVPERAQRLLFSATMPADLRHLAENILNEPLAVEIGRAAPADTITHTVYPVGRQQKTDLLKHLLRKHDPRSVLVFTRTKHGAKRLAEQLDRENFFVGSLQGNLSQNKRQKALDGFRDGDFHILVATDIAARGIDVSRVSHVINYDIPTTAEAYTHRIGRTGRAERTGDAFTFVTPDDEKTIQAIERSLGARLERVKLDDFVYEAHTPSEKDGRQGGGQRRDARPARSEPGGQGSSRNRGGRTSRPRKPAGVSTSPRGEGSSRSGGEAKQGHGHEGQRRAPSGSSGRGRSERNRR
jgi:ATP-dependent RNA helicase RhlE